ncbi:Proactivator polypeptide-like 1 [Linum grandiflorum]
MDMRVGRFLLLVLLLGCSVASSARQISTFELPIVETSDVTLEIVQAKQVGKNEELCTLCQQYTAQALQYLANNKTQTEIIAILHRSCSQVASFKRECISLVDYYAPLFFLEVSSIHPQEFCKKMNLCQKVVAIASQLEEDTCGICHQTVDEVMSKLKDPDTQLEIIELLLKVCNKMESRKAQCKKLVFEYGPLILINAEQFLEKTDICTALHACTSTKQTSAAIGVAES